MVEHLVYTEEAKVRFLHGPCFVTNRKEVKMKKKFKKKDMEKCCNHSRYGQCGGCAYFLGFIGAAVYYISAATGFWMGVLGVLKALVWPAFLVFKLLGM